MERKRLKHIFIERQPEKPKFTSPQSGGGGKIPERDRKAHYNRLVRAFDKAKKADINRKTKVIATRKGVYIDFIGEPTYSLPLNSLEDMRSKKMRVLNIQKDTENNVERATVYVEHSHISKFLKKLDEYIDDNKNTGKGYPKNRKLVNGIADIKAAVLESFWQSDKFLIPDEYAQWCEVWLRTDNAEPDDCVKEFNDILASLKIEQSTNSIHFPERSVLLVNANRQQLESLLMNSDNIAEFHYGRDLSFFLDLPSYEQTQWIDDLKERIELPEDQNNCICILDRGINNKHPLIQPVLSDDDMHAVDPSWGTYDHDPHGHGSGMAGIAIYGDLLRALSSSEKVPLTHILESAKLLPPPPLENKKELWGAISSQGIHRAEIVAPDRQRVVCSSITAENTAKNGTPSSWSAEFDQLASGALDGRRRLFVQSAGNYTDLLFCDDYPKVQEATTIEDPAQAWNIVTVGAHTELTSIEDATCQGYKALAPKAGLSPHTTTSMIWDDLWPIKPDIVMEGGNMAVDPSGIALTHHELMILTTSKYPQGPYFNIFNGTSASAAKAAWFAAKIQAMYPNLWAEGVRALMVHSAEWTDEMKKQYLSDNTQESFKRLMRACGYGVPNLDLAIYSMSNALTLVIQNEIQPFIKESSGCKTNEMHLYELPWPKEALQELADTKLSMRVTLSYFIEPGPGNIGWKDRYRYASHGLRFSLKRSLETKEEFRQRINRRDRDENYTRSRGDRSSRWVIGKTLRDKGSIHSDIWEGTAAELADSNIISVFPCIGWWRERSHLGKVEKSTRYALIVSIETEEETIDLYSEVMAEIKAKIPVVV